MSISRTCTNEKQRKKRSSRLIEIDKEVNVFNDSNDLTTSIKTSNDNDHLITKKQIEDLRNQYGADWLTKSDSNKSFKLNETDGNMDKSSLYQSVEDVNYDRAEDEASVLSSTPLNNNKLTNNSTIKTNSMSNINDEVQVIIDCQNTGEGIILDKIYKDFENEDMIGELFGQIVL